MNIGGAILGFLAIPATLALGALVIMSIWIPVEEALRYLEARARIKSLRENYGVEGTIRRDKLTRIESGLGIRWCYPGHMTYKEYYEKHWKDQHDHPRTNRSKNRKNTGRNA